MRRASAAIAVLASISTIAVWLSDGLVLSIGPLRISSTDAARPLIVAIIAVAAYFALSGPTGARADARISHAMTPRRLAPLHQCSAYKAYGITGRVYLFDLLRPDGPTFEPPSIRDPRPRCPPPAEPPLL